MCEIAIAYDVESIERAVELDERLGAGPEIAKIGLQLFTAAGPEVVRALRSRGRRVFLDLKLHDIPNTVMGAAAEASALGAELLTVHAMGGHEMVAAAVAGAKRGGGGTRVIGVTVLTSLDAYSLPPGFASPFHAVLVIRGLLDLTLAAGGHGIVCSAADLPVLRRMHPAPFYAVTPGIRAAGAAHHDQKRVATMAQAVAAGSQLVVLGRAVTSAADPGAALASARAECHGALASAGR